MHESIVLPHARTRARERTGGLGGRAQAGRPPLRLLLGLGALGALFGLGVLLTGGDPTLFGVLALIPLAGMILYRPVFGVYVVLAGSLLLEQYAIDGLADPITKRIPLFVNIGGTDEYWNLWTHENLSWFTANLLEVLLVWTALALWLRERKAHPLRLGRLGAPLLIFLGAVTFSWVFGLLQGGDFKVSLWEIRALFYMGACYLLTVNLIRTPGQVRIAGWIVIVTIGIKALQGIYRYVVPFHGDLTNVYAVTGHEDALFFDTLLLLAAAFAIYGGPIRQRLLTWGLVPFTIFTLFATRRRAAIFALLVGGIALLVTLPPAKRAMLPKILVPLFLVGLLYVGAFYNSDLSLAKPIQMVKSLYQPTDPRDASSNLYRDLEQYDVMRTIRHNPILGVGFGRPYEMLIQLPEIPFPLRDYIPHNEILWIWLKMGTTGFLIFWLFIGACIVQGSLVLRRLKDPYFQSLAAIILALVLMQIVIAYADLQLTFYRNMVYLGVMLGVLMRLDLIDPLLARLTPIPTAVPTPLPAPLPAPLPIRRS
ncbi:MAG TPA: O-antigen ligase family protein [Chloroflexia bacterium]|nr:O-antigen ligase family protein [Chloroflexia bacterium]